MEAITKKCPMCGKTIEIALTEDQMKKLALYQAGFGHIQTLFEELSPMECEAIKTGFCPDCQKILFGTDCVSSIISEAKEKHQ